MLASNKIFLPIKACLRFRYFLYKEFEENFPNFRLKIAEPNVIQRKNFDVGNYYRSSALKLKNFIEKVTFFDEKMEVEDAFQEQFTTHGLCWTFNSEGSRYVNRTGTKHSDFNNFIYV